MVIPLLILGCGGDSDDDSGIRNISADITIDPPPAGPVVYLQRTGASGDLVTVDVMLDPGGGAVTFDFFNLEIHLVDPSDESIPSPGIVQIQFADTGGALTPWLDTPLNAGDTAEALACYESVSTCADPATGVYASCQPSDSTACTTPGACDSATCDVGVTDRCVGGPNAGAACTADLDCGLCASGDVGTACDSHGDCTLPPLDPQTGVICLDSSGDTLATGKFLAGFGVVQVSQCGPLTAAGNPVKLVTLGLLAATTGEVRVKFILDPAKPGDCDILNDAVDQAVPFDDGNAIFTATR